MAIEFEIQDSNSLEFGITDPQSLEFGTRDIIEVRQSGDYPDLTNKPQINGVILVGNKTTEELLIDVGVKSWNGQTGDVVYTPPEVPVQSVNGQTGDVVLNASDVDALPANTPIPSKTSDLQNDSGYITGITSGDVTSALGFTPYNATNPNGYVNATQAKNAAPVQSVNGKTGSVSLSASDVNALPSNTPIHNVPSGGTSGQVLTKSSNSDYALEWSTPSGSVSSVNGQTGAVVLDAEDVGALPSSTVIPTKTSQLTNDSGFITSAPVTSVNSKTGAVNLTASDVGALPDSTAIPSKTSDLTNDSNFITASQAPVQSVNGQTGTVNIPIPTVPTDVSAFNNDAGYVNATQAANAAPVQSVNNETGAVVLDADDVGALPDSTNYALGASAGGNAVTSNGILYGQVDSTSTATVFTAQIEGVTSYYDGLAVMLRNNKVTSTTNFTININGLGAKPCYNSMATGATPSRDTTIFNANYTMLFVYSETLVSGGAWICYRGYNSDNNTIGYQLRTNSTVMTVTDTARYYKLYFTSADGTQWVPASVNSTNNATAARPVNQRPINPFGRIVYTSANTNYTAGSNLAATTMWTQYALVLGYSFNRTGAALNLTVKKPVYVKCAPQSDGTAIMDADIPIVQDLPTTEDGKIYIYLGIAYDATHIELFEQHPVYYYKDGAIRPWTNQVTSGGGGGAVDSVNGQTGAVVLDAEDVGALPDDTVIPTKTSDLTNDSNFITAAQAPVQSVNGQTGTVSITIPTVPSASTTTPSMDGTASYGSGTTWARADHVHPTDTSRQATLVSGTNIKTINNESLLGSGNIDIQGGGGSVNKLTLYTDRSFTNLWVDQARTTTLLEQYDYDAQALKSSLTNTDIIEVWDQGVDSRATVLSWKMDLIDETYQMTFVFASYTPTFRTIDFS